VKTKGNNFVNIMPEILNETLFEKRIAAELAASPLYVQRTAHDFDIGKLVDRFNNDTEETIPKCKFCTLNCTLEETAVLNYIKQ
jgi:hypothetical protein